MLQSYGLFWRNYANFRGRTGRGGYWWSYLANTIVCVILFAIDFIIIINANSAGGITVSLIILIIIGAFGLATIVPNLSITIRRLHDTGKRWTWLFILYSPSIVSVILFAIQVILAINKLETGFGKLFDFDINDPFAMGGSLISIALTGLVFWILYVLLSLAQTVVWIVLMTQPTSPNAIGVDTHTGQDGYDYDGGEYYHDDGYDYEQGGDYGGYETGGGTILGLSGMYAGAKFPFDIDEELIIGRDAALSHIVITQNAEKISREHCRISFDPESQTYTVVDLSSNGTYENNGRRLPSNVPVRFPAGSVIYLAKPNNSFRLS